MTVACNSNISAPVASQLRVAFTTRPPLQMVELLDPHLNRTGKRGGQCKLSVEDQLLLVLEYWREYRTQFHIATRDFGGNNSGRNSLTSWGLSESAVCRLIQKVETLLLNKAQVPLAWEKTALPKCLQLECASCRCYRKPNPRAQKKTASVT